MTMKRDRAFGGVRYDNVVECMLVVDLGIETVTDEQGQPLGDYRSYIYGRIFFAPGTGPVTCGAPPQSAYGIGGA
ncbi:MAG: hypothetical protein ABR506_09950 [Candidatus Krumholzibacteriia bacterium]